jgi:hypothetical protein
MKSVRFSKVVKKCGRPEVYLLMSDADPDFHKAVGAGKILSLSDEAHGSGTEYGSVGYNKKRHGQLLLFPKSLKSFADAKIIGIKYDLFDEDRSNDKEAPSGREKKTKKAKVKAPKPMAPAKPAAKAPKAKKADPIPTVKKLIPFPAEKEDQDDEKDDELKGCVRQAMRALEKGNSVVAYNILKRIIPDS